MINEKICGWLMDNADAPIRYRVAREFLKNETAVKNSPNDIILSDVVYIFIRIK